MSKNFLKLYVNTVKLQLKMYLLRLLNACIRFIFNISIFNHNLLSYYCNCHILPIKYHIKYKLCLIIHKILNNLSPMHLTNVVIVYKSLRDTRHHVLKISFHQMCSVWNSLPKSLRFCKQTNVFKMELKTYLFKEAFKNI